MSALGKYYIEGMGMDSIKLANTRRSVEPTRSGAGARTVKTYGEDFWWHGYGVHAGRSRYHTGFNNRAVASTWEFVFNRPRLIFQLFMKISKPKLVPGVNHSPTHLLRYFEVA